MKIDHLQNNIPGLTQTGSSNKADASNQDKTPGASIDTLSISKFAARIKQLAQQVDTTSVDLDRVNAIRQAIADGSYKISSEGIANGMLDPVNNVNKP